MAEFKVQVVEIDEVENHPNADRLDLVHIGGYRCITGRDQYSKGDLVAYIPEAALLPPELLAEMGLEGKLSGKGKNRVKAIRLRGELSQGLVYPAREGWKKMADVTEELGITKYEPPIPKQLAGKTQGSDDWHTVRYDIENIKKYKRAFVQGERVIMTEKLHGTLCQIGVAMDENGEMEYWVTSKGLAKKHILLDQEDENNTYVKMLNKYKTALKRLHKHFYKEMLHGEEVFQNVWATCDGYRDETNRLFYHLLGQPKIEEFAIIVIGEIFGNGIQDMGYGSQEHQFRVFDVALKSRKDNGIYYLDHKYVAAALDGREYFQGLKTVPLLYEGPFSQEVLDEHTNGQTVEGDGCHIREGVVVKPWEQYKTVYGIAFIDGVPTRMGVLAYKYRDERRRQGRKILKSISEAYLLRKNGTEYT